VIFFFETEKTRPMGEEPWGILFKDIDVSVDVHDLKSLNTCLTLYSKKRTNSTLYSQHRTIEVAQMLKEQHKATGN
jgi:hypothetical protein